MKRFVYGVIVMFSALCVTCLTGCFVLRNVQEQVEASRLKSDIEKQCKDYEEKNDSPGMKLYLDGLLKAEPKPNGWNESVVKLVNSGIVKAEEICNATAKLKLEIESRCKEYEEKNDGSGMKLYLDGWLKAEPKPKGWNASVVELINSWLLKAHQMILAEKIRAACKEIWAGVKAALDKRDFDTARRLTSTAAPHADKEMRHAVLTYRVGILNEIINPYQSSWIIYEMKAKVDELRRTGKEDEVRSYLDSVALIKDEIPPLEQKILSIRPALKDLYWLDDLIQSYLKRNVAQMRALIDARAVAGKHHDYKAVFGLIDAAIAEMKLYDPVWGIGEDKWEKSMRAIYREMTTAEVNAAILKAKKSLLNK